MSAKMPCKNANTVGGKHAVCHPGGKGVLNTSGRGNPQIMSWRRKNMFLAALTSRFQMVPQFLHCRTPHLFLQPGTSLSREPRFVPPDGTVNASPEIVCGQGWPNLAQRVRCSLDTGPWHAVRL